MMGKVKNLQWNDYVEQSERTINKELNWEEQISNAVMGMSGELGEVTDIVKKILYQGHMFDKKTMEEELGDFMFYLAWFCRLYNIDMGRVLCDNVMKLRKRYPDGFEIERSIKRGE